MFFEHVNITVSDLARSSEFYSRLFGFQTRWQGTTSEGLPAAHVGDERRYLALFEGREAAVPNRYERVGLNHFGVVVPELAPYRQRLAELGVKPHFEPRYEPGERLYFFDPDGNEVELVTYPDVAT